MASHLKRAKAPKTWPILRKTTKFITRPTPKGQPIAFTLPVVVVLRELLGTVDTAAQARRVLRESTVTVNGSRVYDVDAAVGFMDVLEVGGHKHRLVINAGNTLQLVPVGKNEEFTIDRVRGLSGLKGGKLQLNLASGRNALVAKGEYKVGDSVHVSLDGKIGVRYPLAEGACVLITAGSHIGKIGDIKDITGNVVTIETDGITFTTEKKNAYVVGKGKPAITLN
jgi:small subunit ribosomal protein S4e